MILFRSARTHGYLPRLRTFITSSRPCVRPPASIVSSSKLEDQIDLTGEEEQRGHCQRDDRLAAIGDSDDRLAMLDVEGFDGLGGLGEEGAEA